MIDSVKMEFGSAHYQTDLPYDFRHDMFGHKI